MKICAQTVRQVGKDETRVEVESKRWTGRGRGGQTVEQLKCGMQMTQSEMYEIEIETQREARAAQGSSRGSGSGGQGGS